jgi:hypothetical protein
VGNYAGSFTTITSWVGARPRGDPGVRPISQILETGCTDKKENQNFPIYKEIQNGAVAKSYITNGLLIYREIFPHYLIYWEAFPH